MRPPVVLAAFSVAFALLAGCGGDGDGRAGSDSTVAVAEPPTAGAPYAEVARYIDSAEPADPDDFHDVTLDGTTTDLGEGISFVAGDDVSCAVYEVLEVRVSCRVDFTEPLPEPPGMELNWLPDWVDFTGSLLDIGSFRGDAGVFANGIGAELAAGRSLAVGDFRCRADADAVYCVDDAERSGVRLAADGVDAFGCLREGTPPPDTGRRFAC